jgi:hypothetical protein
LLRARHLLSFLSIAWLGVLPSRMPIFDDWRAA